MRLVRTAVAALLSVAALTGCSDGGQANQTLPSTSSSPAETSESLPPLGPPEFPVPDEAREKTTTGAEAALRYYLDLISHQAGQSGEPLRELSKDCELCIFLADRYDADAQAGYEVSGGEYIVETFSPAGLDGDTAEFAISLSQMPVTVIDATATSVAERGSPAITGLRLGASMTWSEQGKAWILNQLVRNN